jgi:hypothetical protein
MREAPCLDCRVLTRRNCLVDGSDGAKPELVCLACAEERECERDEWQRHDEPECACRAFCRFCTPGA